LHDVDESPRSLENAVDEPGRGQTLGVLTFEIESLQRR
jgi:hypothetical protein